MMGRDVGMMAGFVMVTIARRKPWLRSRYLSGYKKLGKCTGCLVIGFVWIMIAA